MCSTIAFGVNTTYADKVRMSLMPTPLSFPLSLWEYKFKRPLYSITSTMHSVTAITEVSSVLFLY